jgi:hypothetical protein
MQEYIILLGKSNKSGPRVKSKVAIKSVDRVQFQCDGQHTEGGRWSRVTEPATSIESKGRHAAGEGSMFFFISVNTLSLFPIDDAHLLPLAVL